MNVRWWKLDETVGLVSVTPDDAVHAWKKKRGSFWADVEVDEPEELDAWLREIGLSDAVRECCLEAGAVSRIVPLDEAVFFEFPIHAGEADSEFVELGFLCLTGLVVTLHRGSAPQLEGITELMKPSGYPLKATTSGLVAMLLLSFSSESVVLAGDLKKSVYALDERMDSTPDDVDADEIVRSKRALRGLDAAVDEQHALFDMVRIIHLPYLDLRSMEESFEVVSRNLSFADRTVDRLEKHLGDLQQRYDTNQQEKTNKRLAVLTVISAIFLPLTLVAGIYGMNFDVMPELHFPYAYPIALGVMASIAIGLYSYFRSNGWLD
jgi:magnesium transporter